MEEHWTNVKLSGGDRFLNSVLIAKEILNLSTPAAFEISTLESAHDIEKE